MNFSLMDAGIPVFGSMLIQNASVSINPPPSDLMRTRIEHHLFDRPEHQRCR